MIYSSISDLAANVMFAINGDNKMVPTLDVMNFQTQIDLAWQNAKYVMIADRIEGTLNQVAQCTVSYKNFIATITDANNGTFICTLSKK